MPEGGRLAQARQLVSRLDFPAAQQLLRDELARAHADPHSADESEADTAALYAGVMLQLNEPHTARTWAAYAHTAARLQHGEFDRRTLHALGLLALAQHRTGALGRAGLLYTQLVEDLTRVEGHRGDRTLAARADAAVVDHARGRCEQARDQLADVVAAYEQRHGAGHPTAIRMLVRLAGMWRDCGDFDQAHRLLAQARTDAVELPPGDDLHRLLHSATRAQADPHHHCGVDPTAEPDDDDPPPPTGSAYPPAPEPPDTWPPPRTAEPDAWPPAPPPAPDTWPQPQAPHEWHADDDSAAERRFTATDGWTTTRDELDGWATTPDQLDGWAASATGTDAWPLTGDPDDRGASARTTGSYAEPLVEVSTPRHAGRASTDHWPDDEIFEPEPTPGVGRPAPGRGPRPSPRPTPPAAPAPLLTTFGTQAAPVAPGRYPAGPPVTGRPAFADRPVFPDRRPYRDDPPRTEPTGRRRGRFAAGLAVVAALVAIAAVIVTLILVNGSEQPAEPSSPGPVGPSTPPAVYGLTLHDEGRQIQLSWTYPANVAAPVIVSVAFAGQPMRPLQSLPAGTEVVTVPGLDPDRDYCLTITLAYAADRMVMAPAVCTER
ncbi:tetratricopeptide repeat protein [Catellatospora tritici]|uniref:tetratricopeptide repeat protein n=1 Tax=Catellatospora tritici TaxID=2851566 RepID=UPI001C2DDED5|nr:tetratricopeptide repeat protein [Catellatospora tritici]MBV1850308.1 tetratricopeptide repeat protein [Catellatospora tritici]